jgi:hypothetical protein
MHRLSMQRWFATLILGALIYWSASPASSEPTRSSNVTVSVEEIGKSVTLIGRLGKPLGQQCEIRGRWWLPEPLVKDYSPRFTVLEVDGVRLDQPIEFNIGQIEARTVEFDNALPPFERWDSLDGQEWRMFAYENGRTHLGPDVPPGQRDVFGVPPAAPYYRKRFTSDLEAIVVSTVKLESKSPVQQRPRSK